MRLYICILVLLPGVFYRSMAQSARLNEVLETELTRFNAMVHRDTVALRPMLADDLYYLHSNGLAETKNQHLAALSNGALVYLSMERAPKVAVRRYGKIALVNGQVQVEGVIKGAPFSVVLNYTAVYRKQKRRWLLVNWQSTRVQTE